MEPHNARLGDAARHRPPEENHSHVSTTERVLATLIDAFGLASSQCAAVAQARIVRLHPTPPRDIPCSRARAGPLRDAARHRPPEKNHSHVSRLYPPPLPRGWALTSFCPTPLSVAAPAHLSRSPRTAGPLSKPASTPTAATRCTLRRRAASATSPPAAGSALWLPASARATSRWPTSSATRTVRERASARCWPPRAPA